MNLFQLKGKPHGIERLPLFLEKDFIAIGWPCIGNLSDVSVEEIETRLADTYVEYTGQTLAYHKGMVNAFVNTMQNQDIVMIAQSDYVHFGQVGPYRYVEQFDNDEDGMRHQRNVHWLAIVERHTLNDKVQEHLRNRATITKFKYPLQLADIDSIIEGNNTDGVQIKENSELVQKAWDILYKALDNPDPHIQVLAATAIVQNKK